jgi:ABC-type transport system involved in cytochrome bd biosynthesis fused ATPase/permease subunit
MPVRNRLYFALMALCLALFVLSWAVVRLYSVTAAVVMSVVAVAIPPIAVIIANAGDEASRHRR